VWCDEQKTKKQQLPISQRRDNKKSEIAKEESRKVKLKKARWRHFYHNTSCNILWFSFEDYLLIRLQKSQKESEKKKQKLKRYGQKLKAAQDLTKTLQERYIILSGLDDTRLKKKGPSSIFRHYRQRIDVLTAHNHSYIWHKERKKAPWLKHHRASNQIKRRYSKVLYPLPRMIERERALRIWQKDTALLMPTTTTTTIAMDAMDGNQKQSTVAKSSPDRRHLCLFA